jgi:hypothetical protein
LAHTQATFDAFADRQDMAAGIRLAEPHTMSKAGARHHLGRCHIRLSRTVAGQESPVNTEDLSVLIGHGRDHARVSTAAVRVLKCGVKAEGWSRCDGYEARSQVGLCQGSGEGPARAPQVASPRNLPRSISCHVAIALDAPDSSRSYNAERRWAAQRSAGTTFHPLQCLDWALMIEVRHPIDCIAGYTAAETLKAAELIINVEARGAFIVKRTKPDMTVADAQE